MGKETQKKGIRDLENLRMAVASANPEEAVVDRIPNSDNDVQFVARFTCPEFTALCPITGQPDFAHLVIDYVPGDWLIESKGLKIYFASFRNMGIFHESCTVMIGKRLVEEVKPIWLRISGFWYPRGGIPIDVWFQTGEAPKEVYVPEPGVSSYRGRG